MRLVIPRSTLECAGETVGRHMPFRELRRIAAAALHETVVPLPVLPAGFRGAGPAIGASARALFATADGRYIVEVAPVGERGRRALAVLGFYVREGASCGAGTFDVVASADNDPAGSTTESRRRGCDAPLEQDPRAAVAAEEPRYTEPRDACPGLGEADVDDVGSFGSWRTS